MNRKNPPLWIACVPLAFLVALISFVVGIYGDSTLSGASQTALLVSTAVCVGIGLWRGYICWEDFEVSVREKVGTIGPAILILLLIGALGGTWMVSGVVPLFIYYGMEIMNPQWFLVAACIICAIVSVVTGSSWTTIATIGVALLGIGKAMGLEDGWIAGAIISGAYFGDKISPLSDTTVLASSTVGTPLFVHIRYMLLTTVPTLLVTLLIFAIAGSHQDMMNDAQVNMVQQALSSTFRISPLLLLVPLLTFLMIIRRRPSLAVLFMAMLFGALAALLLQADLLCQIAGNEHTGMSQLFQGVITSVFGRTQIDTGDSSLNALVATKGMAGMLDTVWLILCATTFGAAMTCTRMVDSIVTSLIRFIRGTVSMVASTVSTGVFLNVVCADQYLSIILTSNMFLQFYKEKGYEPRLLSRSCEDSATVTSVLIPWNTCGMTQSSVLGVSTFCYAPFCFFCWISPLMSILMAAIGWKINRRQP